MLILGDFPVCVEERIDHLVFWNCYLPSIINPMDVFTLYFVGINLSISNHSVIGRSWNWLDIHMILIFYICVKYVGDTWLYLYINVCTYSLYLSILNLWLFMLQIYICSNFTFVISVLWNKTIFLNMSGKHFIPESYS